MNWHQSRLCLAILLWVAVFCFVCVGLFGFCYYFLVYDDFVTEASICRRPLVGNMQLNVLDDLAEAMKALDGKKVVSSFLPFVVSCSWAKMKLSTSVNQSWIGSKL